MQNCGNPEHEHIRRYADGYNHNSKTNRWPSARMLIFLKNVKRAKDFAHVEVDVFYDVMEMVARVFWGFVLHERTCY